MQSRSCLREVEILTNFACSILVKKIIKIYQCINIAREQKPHKSEIYIYLLLKKNLFLILLIYNKQNCVRKKHNTIFIVVTRFDIWKITWPIIWIGIAFLFFIALCRHIRPRNGYEMSNRFTDLLIRNSCLIKSTSMCYCKCIKLRLLKFRRWLWARISNSHETIKSTKERNE